MEDAVVIRDLRKAYPRPLRFRDLARPWRGRERTPALSGVDLAVEPGTIFGLLGPNGAGKTTLVKILCGTVLPDGGTARIEGRDVFTGSAQVRSRIGYVPSDERSFYWRLTGRQNLEFFGRLQGLRGAELDRRAAAVLDQVDLTDRGDERFDGYSTGMKQRLGVARSLLHEPSVLLLDEPTRSLDPAAAHKLRDLLRERIVGELGKTVLLATHDLHEATALCHRLALLHEGKVLRQGSPAEVLADSRPQRHVVEVTGLARAPEVAGVEARGTAGDRWRLRVEHARLEECLRAIWAAGGAVEAVSDGRSSLEEIFTRLVEAGVPTEEGGSDA